MSFLTSYADNDIYGGGLRTRPAEQRNRFWFRAMWAFNIPMYFVIPLTWGFGASFALTIFALLFIGWVASVITFAVTGRDVRRAMDADFDEYMKRTYGDLA